MIIKSVVSIYVNIKESENVRYNSVNLPIYPKQPGISCAVYLRIFCSTGLLLNVVG